VLAAVQRPSNTGATLHEIDPASGFLIAERPLASADVDISTSPSGRYVSVTDRRNRTVSVRTATGFDPCPPGIHTAAVPDAPGTSPDAPGTTPPATGSNDCRCGCRHHHDEPCGKDKSTKVGDPNRPPQGDPARPDPCRPGDASVPDDHGGSVVVDGGRIDRKPSPGTRERDPLGSDCWGNLAFSADRLRWAGSYIVATKDNYMRQMAIVFPDDLTVVRERNFGSQGALVFTAPDSPDIVIFHPRRGLYELAEPVSSIIDALDKGPAFSPKRDEKTFVGQKTLSLIPEHIPTKGGINVLVLPVIEPGQAYNEPNLTKIGAFLDGDYFKKTIAYYEENSFKQAHLHFHLFGRDRGAGPGPLVLKEPIANYFWPSFFAGGVELTRPLPGGATTIIFDGSETMSLRATPRSDSRPPIDLTMRFGAALLRAPHHAFPVKIIIGAGQTGTITATERDGTLRTLNLSFPPQTLEIKQTDVTDSLDAVATYLQGVLASAEAAAAVPARPLFAKPDVRRVGSKIDHFGELHVSLSFAPRPAGPGPLSVLSVSGTVGTQGLGFQDVIVGRFNAATDAGRLEDYMTRLMRQAESANNDTVLNPVLATSAEIAVAGSDLKTKILLSDSDGGPNASITVTATSNTGQLFISSAPLMGSISTKNNANATKRLDDLLNHVFSAAITRPGSSLSAFDGMNAVIVGFVGASAGAPPALAWNATAPVGTGDLREVHKSFVAEHKVGAATLQFKSRWILAFLNGTPDTATLCHELGHAFGFRDLYKQTDYRDDLRYLEKWALMHIQDDLPHHAGYHKWRGLDSGATDRRSRQTRYRAN
jgi:hypothetical protein